MRYLSLKDSSTEEFVVSKESSKEAHMPPATMLLLKSKRE
jgi:hypothetical protein